MSTDFTISSGNSLACSIIGGVVDKRNRPVTIRDKTFELPPDSDLYLYVDWGCEGMVCQTEPPPKKSKPLYRLTTGPDSITMCEDQRATIRLAAHTEYDTYEEWVLEGSTNEDVDWTVQDLLGKAPANATGVILFVKVTDSGTPTNSVGMSFRKPGDTDESRVDTIYPQVSGLWTSRLLIVGLESYENFEYSIVASGAFYYRVAIRGWIYGET